MLVIARCQWAMAPPSTGTGGRFRSRARSGEVRITAPPPSVTRQQSRTVKGSLIGREFRTSSIESGSRRKASGFMAAQPRAAVATSASCSRVVPYSCMWREAASA